MLFTLNLIFKIENMTIKSVDQIEIDGNYSLDKDIRYPKVYFNFYFLIHLPFKDKK